MSESMPEPTLDIFGEQTTSYTRILGLDERGGSNDTSEVVTVKVDEIDTIEDSQLRRALWGKYRVQTDPKAKDVRLVTAHPDGRYKATVEVPKKPLCLMRSEAVSEELGRQTPPPPQPARQRFFRRLLS